jgi:hypothetical protein
VELTFYDVKLSTYYVKLTFCDAELTFYDVKFTTYDVELSTYDVELEFYDAELKFYDVKLTTYDVKRKYQTEILKFDNQKPFFIKNDRSAGCNLGDEWENGKYNSSAIIVQFECSLSAV